MSIWQHYFTDGVPSYLARHYWWAYLWRPGIWLFDHQMIISAILFGYYHRLVKHFLKSIRFPPSGRILLVANAYGSLVPELTRQARQCDFHLLDVALKQLTATRKKIAKEKETVYLSQMNAEKLGFGADTFDTVLLFLLLHELPEDNREQAVSEAIRILKPGGQLLIAEYGAITDTHFFHFFVPIRRVLEYLEPFLASFWQQDLSQLAQNCAKFHQKHSQITQNKLFFSGFYRVLEFRIH